MGLVTPHYEQQIITILASTAIGAGPVTTSIIRLGGPSLEDSESFAGVEFHFQITPTGGASNAGLDVRFYLCYDGVNVDDQSALGNGPAVKTIAPNDIGSSGVYHQTLQYETKDIGFAVRLLLTRFDGSRTLTTIVYARRWRWNQALG